MDSRLGYLYDLFGLDPAELSTTEIIQRLSTISESSNPADTAAFVS